jgi:phosphonate metabolism protein (transferase hexapeptide repeat family)
MLYPINTFPEDVPHERKVLSERPTIHPTARLHQCQIGSWTDIGPACTLVETTLDDYSYLAGDAQIIYSQIGKFCSIASHVRINPGNHPMQRVTQHHMTYRRAEYDFGDTDDEAFFAWRRSQACVIGHDVWIGHGVVIMPGVSIGTGAVIGSAAVVTRDIAPYEIAVGVPARPIKKRFSDDVIEKLLRSAWWDWDRATLEARFDQLLNLDVFLSTSVVAGFT